VLFIFIQEELMASLSRSLRAKVLLLFLCIPLLILSACGGATGSNTASTTGSTAAGNCNGNKGNLTVGSKLDVEGQLLATMYTQLLCKAGYHVTEKAALGNSTIVFQAITSGVIDMYPEYTADGLFKLNIPSTYDPQKDYQAVKSGYNSKYQLTWLDPAPLNDGYALCTTKGEAQKLGITTISQLAPLVHNLVLTSPSDGTAFVDGLQKTYGFSTKSFKKTETVDYALGFKAVESDQSQITVCYGTDATVPQQGFIFLKDDKNGFPAFNAAPLVRNATIAKYPDIPSILNPLAPKLTTDVSIQLQTQVANRRNSGASAEAAIKSVATDFLTKQGML
jgi:osmoprotectant transport system substrate-binding protein